MMMLKTAWRNLWRNKRRTIILVAAVTVGLAGITVFMGWINGYLEQMKENAVSTLTGHAKLTRAEYLDNPVPTTNFAFDKGKLNAFRARPEIAGRARA
ncbi:MAG: hypothetical protein M5R36_24995 [Deltaproteobacteria bacterium]|nr:hypothetical protein [Deltaproteobacteria bacterium]